MNIINIIHLIWIIPLVTSPFIFIFYMLRKEHIARKKMFEKIRKRKITIKI